MTSLLPPLPTLPVPGLLTLEEAKGEFAREQQLLRNYWQRQVRDEWACLRDEAERLTAATARDRSAIQKRQTELEISRRLLAEQAQSLETAKQQWRQEQCRQEADLLEARQHLDESRQRLLRAEETWRRQMAAADEQLPVRTAELAGLEQRISNYRLQLSEMEGQAALKGTAMPPSPPRAPATESPALLPVLAGLVEELFTEHQRLSDFRDELLALREAWGLEWARAKARLHAREEEADAAEARRQEQRLELNRHLAQAQRASEESHLRHRHAEARENELIRERAALRLEQSALLAKVRARALLARTRQRLADRLLKELQRAEIQRHERQLEVERVVAAAQRALFDRQERLDQREVLLNEFEKELIAREWVADHARDYLISIDPKPAAAQAELERRVEIFQKVAQRGVQNLEARQADLHEHFTELESFRQRLLNAQKELERERTQFQLLRLTTLHERELLEAQRDRGREQLRQLKEERSRLRERVRDLEEQVERLSLVLLEGPPPAPRLALAA